MLGNRLGLRGSEAPLETERGDKTALRKRSTATDGAARFSLVVSPRVLWDHLFSLFLKLVSNAEGKSVAAQKTHFGATKT